MIYEGFDIEKVMTTFSNGESSVDILLLKNGDVISSNNDYICDINDKHLESKIEDFGYGWRQVNWNRKDYAVWYNCDEDEVEDVMDDDLGYWDI